MHKKAKLFILMFIFLNLFSVLSFAQTAATPAPPEDESKDKMVFEEVEEGGGNTIKLLQGLSNKKRIRRHLNLISNIKHDEEISIPEVPLTFKGSIDLVDIQRIKGTDTFRILPLKGPSANGIVTIHNKKTGQILVELRIDIRDQALEKMLREVQALLADIDGIEYKIVNERILLDGYVLLPRDLRRIGNVVQQFDKVTSLVGLSPLARKKIVEYIARDINNPEIAVSAVGDYIKLEGFVNSAKEKERIEKIVTVYMPDIVTEKGEEALKNVTVSARKQLAGVSEYVINLIEIREGENKAEPPPKMIQFVIHVVEYSERYLKSFDFKFSPSLTTLDSAQQQTRAPSTINDMASLVNNLLPKLNWARNHGFIRLLDTASILTQDKAKSASISRTINISNGNTSNSTSGAGATAGQPAPGLNYGLNMVVSNPTIKSERSGLVYMELDVNTTNTGQSQNPTTNIKTTVSVRDRQSAALAGIITKKSENQYGGPTGAGAIVTLNHGKGFTKSTSNYVLFVTPIIKSSASSGVEQVKKKFRMKE